MAENLFIRLASQRNERIHWLVTTANNREIIASGDIHGVEQLPELAEKAKQRQVIIVLPSTDVLLKKLNVPAKSARAIKLAAPFMLEDELAQDVDKLFFAYQTLKTDAQGNNCFIATVEKEQLDTWLHWLADANIKSHHMVPEVLLMPLSEDAYSVIELGEQVLMRTEQWQGMTVDLPTWQLISSRWQTEDQINLHCYSPIKLTNSAVTITPMPEDLPLALLAQQFDRQTFNLLQGEYKVKQQSAGMFQHWRLAASLLVVALVLNLAVKTNELLALNAEQDLLKDKIISTYKKAFPDAKRVTLATVKSQLKRKLADVSATSGDNVFFTLMSKLQTAFVAVNHVKPDSIKFDEKRQEIRLQATANNFQEFELFKTALEKAQLTVTLGAQNNLGDKVAGSFSIKEGA